MRVFVWYDRDCTVDRAEYEDKGSVIDLGVSQLIREEGVLSDMVTSAPCIVACVHGMGRLAYVWYSHSARGLPVLSVFRLPLRLFASLLKLIGMSSCERVANNFLSQFLLTFGMILEDETRAWNMEKIRPSQHCPTPGDSLRRRFRFWSYLHGFDVDVTWDACWICQAAWKWPFAS